MHVTASDTPKAGRTFVLRQNAELSVAPSEAPCAAHGKAQVGVFDSDGVDTELRSTAEFKDFRFRSLLNTNDWHSLPLAVRCRFSKRYDEARTTTYIGKIKICRMSAFGKLLAHLLRPVGAPLPTSCDVNVPAVVAVTEDEKTGGQIWTRIYGRHDKFPQIVQSSTCLRT